MPRLEMIMVRVNDERYARLQVERLGFSVASHMQANYDFLRRQLIKQSWPRTC